MKPYLVVTAIAALCVVSACSNRQVYDSLQANEASRCIDMPASELQECLDRADTTYDEYEQMVREAEASQ